MTDLSKALRDRATYSIDGDSLRGHALEAADRIDALEAERDRLRYVLDGVAGAIDTGRNEPLVIWREQIEIARAAISKKDT